jgi:hypothetical protein
MKAAWMLAIALGLSAVASVPAALAQRGSSPAAGRARIAAFAKLPDWSGIWEPAAKWAGGLNGRGDRKGGPPMGFSMPEASFKPEWVAQSRAALAAEAKRNDNVICAFGFPAVMNNLLMFEALVTPEETALIFSRREIRHIYTNGRRHPQPADVWPTLWGDSIGHWEGDTLVVDTIDVQQGRNPVRFSAQAHFVERIRKTGPDTLEAQIRVEDPEALIAPYTTTYSYSRVTDFDRMVHDDCQGSEHWTSEGGQLRMVPPS